MFFRFKNKCTNYTKKKNYQFDGCRKNKLIFMFHTYSSLQILTLADFTYPEFNMIYYLFITY